MGALVGSGAIGTRTQRTSPGGLIRRTLVIAAVGLVEAILILGVVAASLGYGVDGTGGFGPDRPPRPVTTLR